jgi:hypothetical protein
VLASTALECARLMGLRAGGACSGSMAVCAVFALIVP